MSHRMRVALQWVASYLRLSPPRVLKAFGARRPTVIFADGAFDSQRAGIGAVMYQRGSAPRFFAAEVPARAVEIWCADKGTVRPKVRARRFVGGFRWV